MPCSQCVPTVDAHSMVAMIPNGQQVHIVDPDEKGDYYKVTWTDKTGYVKKENLQNVRWLGETCLKKGCSNPPCGTSNYCSLECMEETKATISKISSF